MIIGGMIARSFDFFHKTSIDIYRDKRLILEFCIFDVIRELLWGFIGPPSISLLILEVANQSCIDFHFEEIWENILYTRFDSRKNRKASCICHTCDEDSSKKQRNVTHVMQSGDSHYVLRAKEYSWIAMRQ
jgi:hypothetical protein